MAALAASILTGLSGSVYPFNGAAILTTICLRPTRDAPSVFHEESIWLKETKASLSSAVSSISPAAIAPMRRMEEVN